MTEHEALKLIRMIIKEVDEPVVREPVPEPMPGTEFGPDDIPDHGGKRQYNYLQNLT